MSIVGSEENPVQLNIKQLENDRFVVRVFDGAWAHINDLSYPDMESAIGAATDYIKEIAAGDDITMRTSFGDTYTLAGSKQ